MEAQRRGPRTSEFLVVVGVIVLIAFHERLGIDFSDMSQQTAGFAAAAYAISRALVKRTGGNGESK